MPEAASPTAKKILGEMFGGEGKEARETAKAEAGESRAAAAAEETAERVGSILDEVGTAPAVEKPAEETPAAESKPAEETAPAKSAAEAKSAETPAGEKPEGEKEQPTVPLGVHLAERREKQDLLKEKQRLEAELAAAKAKPAEAAKPKETEDVEPDKIKHPIEHDEWETRQLRRDIAAVRTELAEQKKVTTEVLQTRELEEKTREFDRLVGAHREVYAKESPDFTEKREYLRTGLMKELETFGVPPQFRGRAPEDVVNELEREMIGVTLANTNDPRAPFKRIEALADARGFTYWKAAQTAKPTGTNGSTKPAPKTDAERIAAGAKLESAARTTTTMPGTSPKAPTDGDAMTADKFAALTPAQRRAYKKQHPDALEKIMGGGGAEDSIF